VAFHDPTATNADNGNWTPGGGSPAATIHESIDDAVRDPDSPTGDDYITATLGSDSDCLVQFGASLGVSATTLTLKTNLQRLSDQGGLQVQLVLRLYINSVEVGAQIVETDNAGSENIGWKTATFHGAFSSGDVAEVRYQMLDASRGALNNCQVNAAYIESSDSGGGGVPYSRIVNGE
jgi:hypothetical protein